MEVQITSLTNMILADDESRKKMFYDLEHRNYQIIYDMKDRMNYK